MSIIELLEKKHDLLAEIATIRSEISTIDVDLGEVVSPTIARVRADQAKELGTVNVVVNGVKVKEVIGTTVSWDQGLLAAVRQSIIDAGDDPSEYIKITETLSVPEKAWKDFHPAVRDLMSPARTVTPSTPKLTFEVVDDTQAAA